MRSALRCGGVCVGVSHVTRMSRDALNDAPATVQVEFEAATEANVWDESDDDV